MSVERVGIELEVEGYESAMRKMKEIERLTSTFRGKNAYIEFQGNWDTVENHIRKLKESITALKNEKVQLLNDGASKESINEVNKQLRNAQQNLRMLQTAAQNTGKTLTQTFNSVSSQVKHIGSSMQSLGNALTRFSAPFRLLASGALFTAGYGVLSKVTNGLSSGFSRYDIMHKYPLMMSEYEKANYSASQSIKELEESVLGLPTGLDEIVEIAQRYTLSLGDMEKGTKLAIATNNAFLASMATEQQQYQGMLQLQDLMNGKTLTSKEWMSLGSSMGKAINEIGIELGYSADQMGEFRRQLYAGKISTEDFLDALIKVGTEGGKIADLAQLSKLTWDAVARNIGNRFSKMSERILEELDKISERVTGKSLVQYVADDVLPIINKWTDSIVGWIDKNQNKILGFLRDLKGLDFGGLVKGYIQSIGDLLNLIQKVAQMFSGKNLSGLGRFIGWSGVIGRWLTILGGIVKGMGHPIAALTTLVRAISESRGIGAGGIFGKLFGSGKGGAASVGETTKTLTSFKGLFNAFKGVLAMAGSIAAISGAGFVAFKAVKSMVKDIGEIIEIAHGIDFNEAATVVAGVVAFFGGFMELGYVMGRNLKGGLYALAGTTMIGAITTVISGFAALDSWLLKKAVANVRDIVTVIGGTFTMLKELPSAGSLGNIKAAVNRMVELYDILAFNGSDDGLWSIPAKEAKGLKKRITAISDVIEAIKDSMVTMSGMTEVTNIDAAKGNILKLVNGLAEIYQAVEDGFIWVTKKEANKEASVLDSLASMVQSIDSVYDTLRNRAWTADMDSRIEGIKTMFSKFVELYDQLNVDFGGRYGAKSSERLSSSIENISMIVSAIDSMYDLLRNREWNTDMSSRFGSADKKTGILGMFEYMKDLYTKLAGDYGSAFRNDQSEQISTSLSNLSAVMSSIDKIYDTLRGREWNADIVSRVNHIKGLLLTLGGIKPFIESIGKWEIADVSGNIDKLTSAISSLVNLSDTANGLEGVNLSTVITGLQELVPQVEAMGKAFTEGFIDGLDFNKMESAIKSGLDKLLRSTNGYSGKFRRQADTIARSFTAELRKELGHVDVNTSVTVHITNAIVTGLGTVASAIRNGIERIKENYSYQGGIIYRAGGGSIFRPRGTDTVPAMLTPGEYIQNRHAVAMFGKEFMDKVNALDIDGAMRALHSRFGDRITYSRTSTVNNIVNNNNNQQMTQNVYTNNPAFAKMRRTRYIGAL